MTTTTDRVCFCREINCPYDGGMAKGCQRFHVAMACPIVQELKIPWLTQSQYYASGSKDDVPRAKAIMQSFFQNDEKYEHDLKVKESKRLTLQYPKNKWQEMTP